MENQIDSKTKLNIETRKSVDEKMKKGTLEESMNALVNRFYRRWLFIVDDDSY